MESTEACGFEFVPCASAHPTSNLPAVGMTWGFCGAGCSQNLQGHLGCQRVAVQTTAYFELGTMMKELDRLCHPDTM